MKTFFIDHNIWDKLFELNIDLEYYFPANEFSIKITKEGQYEVKQTPDSCKGLKSYINSYLGSFITTDEIFGFCNKSLPESEQRISGFGTGRFISNKERDFKVELQNMYKENPKRKETQILHPARG